MTVYRDPVVNGAGIVLLGLLLVQLARYNSENERHRSDALRKFSVLLSVFVLYVFTTPVMYPDGDLWTIMVVQLIGDIPGQITTLGTTGTSQEPASLVDRIVYWLQVIGLVVYLVLFFVLSIIPRTLVVVYDNVRGLLGLG